MSRTMKSFKAAISMLLFSSISAIAADLPSLKSAPVAAPAPMWTGFYAGLNAGGTWGGNTQLAINSSYAGTQNPSIGANYTGVYERRRESVPLNRFNLASEGGAKVYRSC